MRNTWINGSTCGKSANAPPFESIFLTSSLKYRIPFYYEMKCGIYVWILWPSRAGSRYVYDNVIVALVQQQQTLLLPQLYTNLIRVTKGFQSWVLKTTIHGVSASELNKLEKQMTSLLVRISHEKDRRREHSN